MQSFVLFCILSLTNPPAPEMVNQRQQSCDADRNECTYNCINLKGSRHEKCMTQCFYAHERCMRN